MNPIIAKSNGRDFESPEPGLHQAVCAFVEDIGTHVCEWQGKKSELYQIVVCFELAEKMTNPEYEGLPFMVSKFYTLSLGRKANLSKDLESWFGKKIPEQTRIDGFDLSTLIGKNCMVGLVEHDNADGNKRIKISTIQPMMKNLNPITVVNKTPPAWIAKKRSESLEATGYQKDKAPSTKHDDLPF